MKIFYEMRPYKNCSGRFYFTFTLYSTAKSHTNQHRVRAQSKSCVALPWLSRQCMNAYTSDHGFVRYY